MILGKVIVFTMKSLKDLKVNFTLFMALMVKKQA